MSTSSLTEQQRAQHDAATGRIEPAAAPARAAAPAEQFSEAAVDGASQTLNDAVGTLLARIGYLEGDIKSLKTDS